MAKDCVKVSEYLSGLKPPRKIVLSQHELGIVMGLPKADKLAESALTADAEQAHYTVKMLNNGDFEFTPKA